MEKIKWKNDMYILLLAELKSAVITPTISMAVFWQRLWIWKQRQKYGSMVPIVSMSSLRAILPSLLI